MMHPMIPNAKTIQTPRRRAGALAALLTMAATPAMADPDAFRGGADFWHPRVVDCDRGHRLARAVAHARPGETLRVSGVCRETVTVLTDGLTLDGGGTATLDGGGQDAVTIDGAHRVSLQAITIQQAATGVVVKGGASVTLRQITVQGSRTGIRVDGAATADVIDSVTQDNAVNGVEVDGNAAVRFSGQFTSQRNNVFGLVLGNNANATFSNATAVVNANTLGIQIGIGSSATLADAATTVTANDNASLGVTVVVGSHLFLFAGALQANDNRLDGVTLSASDIAVDAGARLEARNNGRDGVGLDDSQLRVFNFPPFSGAPGTSTVAVGGNGRHGVRALSGSVINLAGQSRLVSQANTAVGLLLDNGSAATLINSDLTGNPTDVDLRFGSRADLTGATVGSVACDSTALLRGYSSACPLP